MAGMFKAKKAEGMVWPELGGWTLMLIAVIVFLIIMALAARQFDFSVLSRIGG
ncbi:hypothetical protein J4470_01105 [Candidatus Woesearchaeota archaeon]|nr:hypothetical protein [Candidatus Woesearchaeota archaeon]